MKINCILILALFAPAFLLQAQPERPALLQKGIDQYFRGSVDSAVSTLHDFTKLNQDNAEGFGYLALAYAENGDYISAVEAASTGDAINPRNSTVRTANGYLKYLDGNYHGALQDATAAIYYDKKDIKGYMLRANIKADSLVAAHYSALVDVKRVLELDEDNLSALLLSANLNLQLQRLRDGQKDFESALRLVDPHSQQAAEIRWQIVQLKTLFGDTLSTAEDISELKSYLAAETPRDEVAEYALLHGTWKGMYIALDSTVFEVRAVFDTTVFVDRRYGYFMWRNTTGGSARESFVFGVSEGRLIVKGFSIDNAVDRWSDRRLHYVCGDYIFNFGPEQEIAGVGYVDGEENGGLRLLKTQ
ncbi:MAG: hypothetical protein WC824_03895 [Bacteroidota bacterium]